MCTELLYGLIDLVVEERNEVIVEGSFIMNDKALKSQQETIRKKVFTKHKVDASKSFRGNRLQLLKNGSD